jgi:Family of unknown function (DUF6064)
MSELWTYSLASFLLFSPRTYYRLFELYNLAIWPAQVLAFALGLAILVLWRRGGIRQGRAIAAILAACWLFVAWAYLLKRYDTINWAARYFAVGFAVEALLLAWTGIVRGRLAPGGGEDAISRIGLGVFILALAGWPLIGPLLGRAWQQAEIFGVCPDPTVVATLGVLLAADRPHWLGLVVPLTWCAIGGATLWAMESPDAPVMPLVAAVVVVLMGGKTLQSRRGAPEQA